MQTSNGLSVENDPELKAYIYQHLVDLQPYLAPESQVAVLVGQETSEFHSRRIGHGLWDCRRCSPR